MGRSEGKRRKEYRRHEKNEFQDLWKGEREEKVMEKSTRRQIKG